MNITWGLVYWPCWLFFIAATFLPTETYALITNPANTLSDYCWHQLNVTRALTFNAHGVAWWASLITTLLAFAVLVAHIWFRAE